MNDEWGTTEGRVRAQREAVVPLCYRVQAANVVYQSPIIPIGIV